MKLYIKTLLLCLISVHGIAQNQKKVDSLKNALSIAKTDSARCAITFDLADIYRETNREISMQYDDHVIDIAKRNDKMVDVSIGLFAKGYELMHLKRYPEAYRHMQQALDMANDPKNEGKVWYIDKTVKPQMQRMDVIANIHHVIGHLMGVAKNTQQQLIEYKIADSIGRQIGDKVLLGMVNMNLGTVYFRLNKIDSALLFSRIADDFFQKSNDKTYVGYNYSNIGKVFLQQGKTDSALMYFRKDVASSIKQNNLHSVGYDKLADYFLSEKQKDSALFYAVKNLKLLHSIGEKNLGDAYEALYKSYKLNGITDSAYKYQGLALIAKDSSYNNDMKGLADFQQLSFSEQLRLQKLEKERAAADANIRIYVLLAGIGVLLLLAGVFYRNNRQKQKANNLLSEQKEEIKTQRDNLGQALDDLKNTQTQLVQSEKMASLGELTAGIAHEIQNPLNFVNNFSEVNTELVDELLIELQRGDIKEAKSIALDLQENEKKVNMHGKRADSIVKGMLEHSRASTGIKELTDINKLGDEYLRLAYHGLRAKDKSFNAELITHFDETLPLVKVIPQDMGRVLLNLFNNAFYAVHQKQKTAGNNYKPTVEIKTFTPPSGGWGAVVRDNGNGIPHAIKDKIMQPFFTTKPTGEGTGLGLSLSYDIVVKGHGGSIAIETKEGEFTAFIISLPF